MSAQARDAKKAQAMVQAREQGWAEGLARGREVAMDSLSVEMSVAVRDPLSEGKRASSSAEEWASTWGEMRGAELEAA